MLGICCSGGDTTDMRIIDSYNKTFNTIHNTTNNTNNYKANVRLSDFLNNYTKEPFTFPYPVTDRIDNIIEEIRSGYRRKGYT